MNRWSVNNIGRDSYRCFCRSINEYRLLYKATLSITTFIINRSYNKFTRPTTVGNLCDYTRNYTFCLFWTGWDNLHINLSNITQTNTHAHSYVKTHARTQAPTIAYTYAHIQRERIFVPITIFWYLKRLYIAQISLKWNKYF